MATKTLSVKLSLNDKQFQTNLRKATRSIKKFGQSMQQAGSTLSKSVTLPILALGGASVKLASDFEETQSKFNTVFKDISALANSTAKSLETDFGLSSKAAMTLLGNTGDLLTGFGFTQEEALSLSNEVNKLAVDLASFTNVEGGAEAASQALTKALLGERESVKQLGIAITEADLKSFAEEQGLVFKELDRVAKATLTFELASRQSANAIGDYERTSGSFANQTRKLRADLENLGVQIGQKLLPIVTKIVNKVSEVIAFFSRLDDSVQQQILGFTLIAATLGPFLIILGTLTTTLLAISAKFIIITAAVVAFAAGLIFVVDNFEAIKERLTLDFLWNSIVEGVQTTLKVFGFFIKGYNNLIDSLGGPDALKATNIFDNLAEGLEGLKKETKDYENDFNSFGESISNTVDKIAPKFGQLFGAMGGGSGGSGKTFIPIKSKTRDDGLGSPSSLGTVSMPSDMKNEGTDLMDVFMNLDLAIQKVGETMSNVLASGAEDFESFGESVKSAARTAIGALISEGVVAAVTRAIESSAFLPLPLIPVVAGLAGGLAKTAFNSLVPAFAEGGLVSGATMGLIGEGPGTSISNPEVIAPLDKLKGMIGGDGGGVEVFGRISGADILISSDRARDNRKRTRGY
tara:strand:- start:1718 stop:3619 length:1902 start_codon:yes stop_codon:yes gene_type:complete